MCKRQAGRKIPCEREKDYRRRHGPNRLSRRRDSCRHQTRAPLLDLALLASTHPGVMAGVFTQNRIMAAPVLLGRRQLTKHTGQAIIVNSGNANALTGSHGMTDALEIRKLASTALRLPVSSVFVGSTGVIGRPLPMPVIRQAIPPLTRLLSRSGHKPAAQAIMTTDTIHKEVAVQAKIGQRILTIGGYGQRLRHDSS